MGLMRNKKKVGVTAPPLSSLMDSRPQFEAKFSAVHDETESFIKECSEVAKIVAAWSDRVKLATVKLNVEPKNATFQILHDQAVINHKMEQEKLDALLAHKDQFQEKCDAALEGLKAFDRLELVMATANRASVHNSGIREVIRSLAQASIDAGIDLRDIKHAEYVAQARTELSLGLEPMRTMNA